MPPPPPHRRGGTAAALMEWLFDERGRLLFRWLFAPYGRRLAFTATHLKNAKTGADLGNGLAMLKLSAFAYLSPLDTDQGLGGSDYLRWSLAFDGHRHLNEPSVRGNKP